MFDPGTLAPTLSTNTTSTSDDPTSTTISSNSTATPVPTSSFLSSSTSILPPISSPTAITRSHQSISAISLSLISSDDTTLAPTSTSAVQTTITVTVVETAALSSETPQHTGFVFHTGAIIGIAIGATFLLLLIILFIFFACRHYSKGSNNLSMEDIFAASRNASWRSPLEADDDDDYFAPYGRSISPNFPRSFGSHGHDDGRFFDDHLSAEGNGSAESADASGASLMKAPVAQTFHRSKNPKDPSNYSSDHTSRPWWHNTEPLNVNKRSNSQQPPLSVDSHVSARSTGSSGEAFLLGEKTRRSSITEPKPIHKTSGRRHYFTPPTAFVLGHDSSLEYATRRIRQHQDEQKQQDLIDQSISQIILARLRRPSTATTVNSCSQYTTIRSEGLGSSRTPSHMYPPSLLNPPMVVAPSQGVSSHTPDNMINQHRYPGAGETSERLFWPSVILPPASPAPSTDTSSMVEGLLHPRLGTALAQSQQASFTSLRDHEDYTRPIIGLVNNHIQSTTTFDTLDLGEGERTI